MAKKQKQETEKYEVAIALGTRAELIKMAPVMKAFSKRKVPYYYVHSGQHEVRDLARELGVKEPDLTLEIPSAVRGRFAGSLEAIYWSLRTMWRLRKVFLDKKKVGTVKLVLVHGDTMTTATAAIAAKSILLGAPKIGHVEAGLRSHDLAEPFPEEISRRIADYCSDYYFVPTALSKQNLLSEGCNEKKIFVTGNTGVDVLKENLAKARAASSGLSLPKKPFVFAQMHRQENIKDKKRLQAFVGFLEKIPATVWLIYLENTASQAKKFGLEKRILSAPNIAVSNNLPYLDYLKLASNAACIITDGGGQTEEAATMGIPCIVFRKSSERQEAEKTGAAMRVGFDEKKALKFAIEAIEKKDFFKKAKNATPPYGEGKAGEKIVDAIIKSGALN